jgi:hypothetical protein
MLPLRMYVLSVASMLAGASVVHWVLQPDTTIPKLETEDEYSGAFASTPPEAPPRSGSRSAS